MNNSSLVLVPVLYRFMLLPG